MERKTEEEIDTKIASVSMNRWEGRAESYGGVVQR